MSKKKKEFSLAKGELPYSDNPGGVLTFKPLGNPADTTDPLVSR